MATRLFLGTKCGPCQIGAPTLNQAINVNISIFTAQRYHRPKFSFIADACRESWNAALGTSGQVILPKAKQPSTDSQVDQFFATALGDVSQQYQPAQVLASYGVFSKQVLIGLKGVAAWEKRAVSAW